jgi:hypothetical protein
MTLIDWRYKDGASLFRVKCFQNTKCERAKSGPSLKRPARFRLVCLWSLGKTRKILRGRYRSEWDGGIESVNRRHSYVKVKNEREEKFSQ